MDWMFLRFHFITTEDVKFFRYSGETCLLPKLNVCIRELYFSVFNHFMIEVRACS